LKSLLKPVLICALAISVFAILAEFDSAQTSPVSNAVQISEQVYADLSAADGAGANVTVLAHQYNAAMNLIDRAQRLDSLGNHTGAALLANQAESILRPIPAQARELKDDALTNRQTENRYRILAIPLEALIVALAAAALMAIHRRVKFKQAAEMRVVAR
jgi:hypothetical protein